MNGERRAFRRRPVRTMARCTPCRRIRDSHNRLISFTKDISLGGSRMVVSEIIQTAEAVEIILEVPVYSIPLLIYGKVVWANDLGILGKRKKNITEAGVKFLKMDPIDAEKLRNFVETDDKANND